MVCVLAERRKPRFTSGPCTSVRPLFDRQWPSMLTQLKRASRRGIALIWAVVVVFALAPVISVAYGGPAGVLSHYTMHAHADGDHDHVHYGPDGHHHPHGHHHHDHDGHHHDHD